MVSQNPAKILVGRALVHRLMERREVAAGIGNGLGLLGIKPRQVYVNQPDPFVQYQTMAQALLAAELAKDQAGRRSLAVLLDEWEEDGLDTRLMALAAGCALMVASDWRGKLEDPAAAQAFIEGCKARLDAIA